MKIAIISGSGFYEMDGFDDSKETFIESPSGDVKIIKSKYKKHDVFFIARHGKNHERLPNLIPYLEIIRVLKILEADLIIGTSIMGVLDASLPLANLFLFDDLYFPDNRLPDGRLCSLYTKAQDKKRGHYLFNTPFSKKVNEIATDVASDLGLCFYKEVVHAHANGPRFNSRAEIRGYKLAGCQTLSQTVGPEIILAGEAEIPYLLLGFGVDYANGIMAEPTPIEILNENMLKSKDVFVKVILGILDKLEANNGGFFNGFVYRFE